MSARLITDGKSGHCTKWQSSPTRAFTSACCNSHSCRIRKKTWSFHLSTSTWPNSSRPIFFRVFFFFFFPSPPPTKNAIHHHTTGHHRRCFFLCLGTHKSLPASSFSFASSHPIASFNPFNPRPRICTTRAPAAQLRQSEPTQARCASSWQGTGIIGELSQVLCGVNATIGKARDVIDSKGPCCALRG